MSDQSHCYWTDAPFGEAICELPAAGRVVVIREGRRLWPLALAGEFCLRHGQLIVNSAPRVDPVVVIRWEPF